MTEKTQLDRDDARSFETVLGHELHYISLKRTAAGVQKSTNDYSHYQKFEKKVDELNDERNRLWFPWRKKRKTPYADSQTIEEDLENPTAETAQSESKEIDKLYATGKKLFRSWKTHKKECNESIDQIETELDDLKAKLENDNAGIRQKAWKENLLGLALSGGGIRSATFNLGILQSLANYGWLRRLDYLSTVSGGGYIGGWLTALINRENTGENNKQNPGEDNVDAECDQPSAIERVECKIRTRQRGVETANDEDDAITFLRQYSNYLTPRTGLFSADTWSALTIYIRNVLLNLIILVAVIGCVLLLPRILAIFFAWLKNPLWLVGASMLLATGAAVVMGFNLASLLASDSKRRPARQHIPHGQERLLVLFILPFFLIALLCSIWVPDLYAAKFAIAWLRPPTDWLTDRWVGLPWLISVALAYASLWFTGYITAVKWPNTPAQNHGVWFGLFLAAFFAGAVGGMLIWLLAAGLTFGELEAGLQAKRLLQITVGPPLLLAWVYLLAVIHTGFMSIWLADGQREWLSRLGAWMMVISIGWVTVFGIALFGPLLLDVFGEYSKIALTSGWLLTTLAGLIVGRGPASDKNKTSLPRRALVSVAPYVFAIGFVIAISGGVDAGVRWTNHKAYQNEVVTGSLAKSEQRYQDEMTMLRSGHAGSLGKATQAYLAQLGEAQENPWPIIIWFFGFAFVFIVQGKLIDVNEFSLHHFYGNRLIRCYLGASVTNRGSTAQKFTGFNRSDDVLFAACDLEAASRPDECNDVNRRIVLHTPGPFPIINTAINLVGGDELAWQQRKAGSFAMTPLYCGFEPGKVAQAKAAADKKEQDKKQPGNISEHGYRPTKRFASSPVPLTLGTAITVSGAAASPNMGYHTTPALAFLLTIFNVRLGRWVGNPRHRKTWQDSGPTFAPKYLLAEVFGLTRNDTAHVYLSDGGHFDNLGIYELVKRRCRFIVACDAGADPEFKFEDLGNAIRKCRTDLGADIRVDVNQIANKSNGKSQWYCAMGEVIYDYGGEGEERGKILYIKTSLTGNEPEDVINYARNNPSFPHQTTGDQFFDEAQFESYRRLGEHVGDTVLGRCTEEATTDKGINVENAFVRLNHQWYPPLQKGDLFTQHTKTLSERFDRLRRSENLAFLDAQMYPEWKFMQAYWAAGSGKGQAPVLVNRPHAVTLSLPATADELRSGFYFCNSLIQLMEDVYFDLDLENDWEHPDNRGWMNLFKHWAWVGMFRVAWAISAATYGRRFQLYCERHLDMQLGNVEVDGPFAVSNFTEARSRISQWNTAGTNTTVKTEYEDTMAMLFQNGGKVSLNQLEVNQVLTYLDHIVKKGEHSVTEYNLHQLQMRVEAPTLGTDPNVLFHFVFGYALLRGQNHIELFRVQDHLRKLGLARHALDQLWTRVKADQNLKLDIRSLADPDVVKSDFTVESRRTFINLFDSVKQERDGVDGSSY